ncbi:MAG: sigma-54-dependent Fis family transcriptional regulator [bacterium]|nr:sigma-54-dependent Fis family transcriptional regulator [bacterium]
MSSVLIVEDDGKIRANLLFQMREAGLCPTAMENAEAALAQLVGADATRPDLLLLDVRLPGMSGVELVRRLAEAKRLPPTIIISGEASISETVEALRLGVHDFIEKPFSKERLLQSIRNTLEHTALRREVAQLRSELAEQDAILGAAPAVETLRERIARAAPTDARVLIRGESGTGKELVANALHRGSSRCERPLIKINCAAIPDHLIEDELFGHVRGAFTDARQAKPGLFEEADGGTLFLDEIGDMDYALQARLLRVLEDGRVRRVGDTRDREVDVRVIAATHCDLEKAVRSGEFREDLYFRLAHLPIEVPALRERPGDVRLLFVHFLESFAERHRSRPRQVDDELVERLERYPWPGNVRELRNLCERLVVFGSDPLTADQLPSSFLDEAAAQGDPIAESGLVRLGHNYPTLSLRDFKTQCEREYIESILRRTRWNITAAARILDIQRTYLHQKISTLGLHRPHGAQVEGPEAPS